MRILRINDILADIDEQTTIGIDLQCYDVKNPNSRFIKVSNTFTIPCTANNLGIFGNPQIPYSIDTTIYDENYCNYYIGNWQIIENAKCRVEEIGERISIFVFEKNNFWDNLKSIFWPQFVSEYLAWAHVEYNVPILSAPSTDDFQDFIQRYIDSTSSIVLPLLMGNLYNYQDIGQKQVETLYIDGGPAESTSNMTVTVTISNVNTVRNIAHTIGDTAQIVASKIMQDLSTVSAITANYDVIAIDNKVQLVSKSGIVQDNTLNIAFDPNDAGFNTITTSEDTYDAYTVPIIEGNLDKIYNNLSFIASTSITLKCISYNQNAEGGHFGIFIRSIFQFIEHYFGVSLMINSNSIWTDSILTKMFIMCRDLTVNVETGNCYFYIDSGAVFEPYKNQKDKADKTLYDFVMSVLKIFNIINDDIETNGVKEYRFKRLDEIDRSSIVDWSGNLSGKPKYKPYVDGMSQNNYIKFKEIYPNGDSTINSKNIICSNKNLDNKTDYVEIDAYIPSILNSPFETKSILNVGDKESFKTFCFFITDGNAQWLTDIYHVDYRQTTPLKQASGYMQIAAIYDLNSEYNVLARMLNKPVFYEIQKWLSIVDVMNLEFWKRYYIKELGGCFFINKISGFNPDKSQEPTTIELIKVSNDTPYMGTESDYYVDGLGNHFVDGSNNYFY